MENTAFTLCIWFILWLLCPLQLAAAVYQWTDEHGRVQYSDRPANETATEVKIRPAPGVPQAGDVPQERRVKQQRMLDVYEEERAAKKEQADKAKQEREERKRKCLNARARYDDSNRARGIYDYLENGERKYLDKHQRSQYMERLKANVAKYCD